MLSHDSSQSLVKNVQYSKLFTCLPSESIDSYGSFEMPSATAALAEGDTALVPKNTS